MGDVDKRQLVDETLTLNDGAIMYPGMKVGSWMWRAYAESGLYSADVPVQDFTEEQNATCMRPRPRSRSAASA